MIGGTGHHLIQNLIKLSRNRTDEYADASKVRNYLWNLDTKVGGLFTFHNAHAFEAVVKNVYHGFQYYIDEYNVDHTPRYLTLNCLPTSMTSYPNFFTSQHQYEPNLHILAKIAELASVDYRVLVMVRDPVYSIVSVFNRFLKQSSYKQILKYIDAFALSQRHLLRQIGSVDKLFYTCIEYENFGNQSKSVEDKILNLIPDSKWPFSALAKETFAASIRTIDFSNNLSRSGGKIFFPITYAQIRDYVRDKMDDDYHRLLSLCEIQP